MNSSEVVQTQKKPVPQTLNSVKINTLNSLLQAQISSRLRFSLLMTFLLVPFLFIYITRTSPQCFPAARIDPAVVSHSQPEAECPSGRVYVYDLPSKFNKDFSLLAPYNCPDLDPVKWQCGIVSNHGFGGPATELRRLLPESLSKSWYRTNQFALEVIFHERILKHKCRTLEPESATAFYIPFYAGLAVAKYLWKKDFSMRDRSCIQMLQWIKTQKDWKRSNGSDHFMTIGRIAWDFRRLTEPTHKWGSTFLNMPDMQNVTRFIIEKAYGVAQDISVPYPTGFHPETKEALNQWQDFARGYNRPSLFTFVGGTRDWIDHDFRAVLFRYCQNEPGSCRLIDCGAAPCASNSSVVLESLLGSDFCLQPRGDSLTRRSVFDCMVAGSIPVFFWKGTAYDQYKWFLPGEPESYSVFIHHNEVRNGTGIIKQVLMGFSKEEIRRKREKVIETIPRLIYGMGNGGLIKDAFDIAFDRVLERIQEEKNSKFLQ